MSLSLAQARFIVRIADEKDYAWDGFRVVTKLDGKPYRFKGLSFPAKMILALEEEGYMMRDVFWEQIMGSSVKVRFYTPTYYAVLLARWVLGGSKEGEAP